MTDIAYHFTGDRLRDGSPIPPVGHALVYHGEIALCERGYHWSRTPWQALQYAPGNMLHRVRVGGTVIEEPGDKGVSSERTIIATIDATYLLRRFAADQALSVAHQWSMPDVVREYLTTLDESKRAAAKDAAEDAAAAEVAVAAAAWATGDAARGAAGAAMAAAEVAVAVAARAAARAAADAGAARDAAADDFNRRVEAAFAEVSP